MTVSSERERVKEKIVKLLNVTRERGASENEAIMAAERAAELMAHFDIEVSELSIRSTRSAEKTARAVSAGASGRCETARSGPYRRPPGAPSSSSRRSRSKRILKL